MVNMGPPRLHSHRWESHLKLLVLAFAGGEDGFMPSASDTYLHGHHDSVLRSHRWRTAENSAGYLLPRLAPDARVLDVGCGPGTITADLAARVPGGHVTGIDAAADVLA